MQSPPYKLCVPALTRNNMTALDQVVSASPRSTKRNLKRTNSREFSQTCEAKKQKILDNLQDAGVVKDNTNVTSPALTPEPAVSMSLPTLLDFTGIVTHQDISSRMANIADLLLCHYILEIKPNVGSAVEYEFMEVEFYLLKVPSHPDPFTHGAEEQRSSGRW